MRWHVGDRLVLSYRDLQIPAKVLLAGRLLLLVETETPAPSVGDRLRWARETQEPWLNSCAEVMNIEPSLWAEYEAGTALLPWPVAEEFAHRFSVSVDYLFVGALDGIAPLLRNVLLQAHPELSLGAGALALRADDDGEFWTVLTGEPVILSDTPKPAREA
jgi:hypothetical protein